MADNDRIVKKKCLGRFVVAQSVNINWSEVLDTDVDKFISGHASILGCAKDLLVCPILSAVASCMGPETVINVTQHWTERPLLWSIVAARRGERKTTVFKKLKIENVKLEKELNALNSVNSDKSTPRRIVDEQNIQLLFSSEKDTTSETPSSIFVLLDDLGAILARTDKDVERKFWNYCAINRSYDEPDVSATCCHGDGSNLQNQFVNFSANIQALDVPSILEKCDGYGLLERAIVLCAPDWCPSGNDTALASHNSPSLQSVLSSVRNLHQVQNVTYTFSPDGERELYRCFEDLHKIKARYTDDEVCRGSVNFAFGHLVKLSAVLTALKNGLAIVNRGSFLPSRIIDQDTVRNVYTLVVCLLHQKFALFSDPGEVIHASNTKMQVQTHTATTNAEEFDSTETKNFNVTTSCIVNEESNDKDVIEINDRDDSYEESDDNLPRTAVVSKIDLSNVPSSSLDFQITDIKTGQEYAPTDTDIMVLRDVYSSAYTSHRPRDLTLQPTGQPVFPDQQMDIGQMGQMMASTSVGTTATSTIMHHQTMSMDTQATASMSTLSHLAHDQVPDVEASGSGRSSQTSNRPIPRQIFANKTKFASINKNSHNIYKMPEGEFLFKCNQKIKKLLLTKGRMVTASYACQYRLFPPVPLEQRVSSLRTTHPAWAATKFFEKLESLGLGTLLVFRGQSVKFQKTLLEDMTDSARQILKKIRVSEEDYMQALVKSEPRSDMFIHHGGK